MRFALSLPNVGSARELVDVAALADRNGWDAVFVWDHIHLVRQLQLDVHDPWVLLGAMAHATSRVRLGAMVTPLARRRPHKFAKEVVTLDHLSGGRAMVGIGLGYPPSDEFEAFGDDGADRVRAARTDEAIDLVTRLWTGEPVEHHGLYYNVAAQLRPTPLQSPRPPIWVGFMWPNRLGLARGARWDGVVPVSRDGEPVTPALIADMVAALGPLKRGFDIVAGRDASHTAADYEAAGATWLVESRWPAGDWLRELAGAAGRPPIGGRG